MPRDLADEQDEEQGESCAAVPAGLVYVTDALPGIRRRRSGKGFRYLDPDGRTLRDAAERERINKLAIPPAYRDVWICPLPNGHLQATGLDDRGRKQYRYHPDWQAWRAEVKYSQLAAFGMALPKLRRRVARDLQQCDAGDLGFSLAALATLLDHTHIRVGNPEYTAANGTFGATTLQRRHLSLRDGTVKLRYKAKGGKQVTQTLRDRRLHRILHEVSDLPGRNLFTYLDEDGEPHSVCSHHVNGYIAEATGVPGATGKTFRTWAGTLTAFTKAREAAEAKVTIRDLCQAAAAELMNTPAICRSSYIHPRVLDLATLKPHERVERLEAITPIGPRELRADERRLLGLLGEEGSERVA
jgi:DNA topoisomerase I